MSFRILAIVAFVALLAVGVMTQTRKAEQSPSTETNVAQEAPPAPTKPHETPQQTKKKKAAFFALLVKPAKLENEAIMEHRRILNGIIRHIKDPDHLDPASHRGLIALMKHYRLQRSRLRGAALLAELQKRIDIVPLSLILAQAANESAWGTSRFAKLGNNYFGQWCMTEGCGIVPAGRADGDTHEVASFDSVNDSVRSYIRNLNTHPAYKKFRELRARLRAEQQPVTGVALAEGLSKYSQRGQDYVNDLIAMIRVNKLARYDVGLNVIDVATADSDLDESTALKTNSSAL